MASLVLGVAGAAVGSFFGNPALGWSIGSALGGALFAPKTTITGPRLNDLTIQSSTYGKMIPIVFGTYRIAGNVFWEPPSHDKKKKKKIGKGGGQSQVSYVRSTDFAVAICEGPITGIRKIWANGKLIYNLGDAASVTSIIASNLKADNIYIYTGSETQLPNSLIQAREGIANTPAFRGIAYVVFNNMQLEDYGNQLPNLEFEVVSLGSYTSSRQTYGGTNPAWTDKNYVIESPDKVRCFTGDWNTSYATSGVNVFDIYPDGSTKQVNTTSYQLPYTNVNIATGVSHDDSWVMQANGGNSFLDIFEYSRDLYIDTYINYRAYNVTSIAFYSKKGKIFIYGYSSGQAFYCNFAISARQAGILFYTAPNPLFSVEQSGSFIYTCESTGTSIIVKKWNKSTLVLDSTLITFSHAGVSQYYLRVKSDSEIYLYVYTDIYEISTGTAITISTGLISASAVDIPRPFNVFNGIALVPQSLLPASIPMVYMISNTLSRSYAYLSDIITSLSARAGLSASDIDVSALTAITVGGYVISSQGSVRSAIEPLLNFAYVDAVESDGKIKYVVRGGSIAVTIPEDDLAAHDFGSEIPDQVALTRTQEVDLPLEIAVRYADYDKSYQVGTQYSRRLITSSKNSQTVDIPIAMTGTKAKEISDVLLYNAWQGRNKIKIAVGNKYSYLEPTDVIAFSKGSINYIARITNKNEANGIISLECVSENIAVYTQSNPAVSGPSNDETVNYYGDTRFYFLDINLLRDADDGVGFYAAACGIYTGWEGVQLYKSPDGTNYTEYDEAILDEATLGYCNTTLGNFLSGYIFDESNTLSVTLYNGTLSSVTELQVLNGTNYAAIGNPTLGYEIVGFKNATLTGTNTYTISGLLRGCRGTEYLIGTHTSNEDFVFLDSATIAVLNAPTSEFDATRYYKPVSINQYINNVNAVTFANTGKEKECYSPVQINGGFTPNGDMTINWVRRNRLAGAWIDYIDVPNSEATESYQVEIRSASDSATLRTTTVTSATTLAYTAANMNTDFGYYPSDIIVNVYQNSTLRGIGYKGQGTIKMPKGKVYLPFDGANGATTFPDSFGHVTTRAGSLQISTAQSKFGGASCLFNGTTDYLDITYDNDLNIGTNDFTIALWAIFNSVSGSANNIFDWRTTSTSNWGIQLITPGADPTKIEFRIGDSDTASFNLVIRSTTTMAANTKYHIAASRQGSTFRLFINGNLDVSGTYSGYIYLNRANFRLGANCITPGQYFGGYLDDFLFVNGAALYTANFTPPTQPYLEP